MHMPFEKCALQILHASRNSIDLIIFESQTCNCFPYLRLQIQQYSDFRVFSKFSLAKNYKLNALYKLLATK